MINIRENEIESASKWDFIDFSLTLVRPTVDFFEAFEVGYYQDHTGYWFYSAWIIQGEYWDIRHFRVLPENSYSLRLVESDGRFEAYVDDELVDYGSFSADVSEERRYAAQGESSDPSNEMRGHFWNLMYNKSDGASLAWSNIEPYQDSPYYTRLSSTDDFHSTLLGDVNLDYYVDISDAALISYHFTSPGWPPSLGGYAAKADINHDGNINIMEATYINIYWHQGW